MSRDRDSCIACQGTGVSYWTDGFFGECWDCDPPKKKKTKKKRNKIIIDHEDIYIILDYLNDMNNSRFTDIKFIRRNLKRGANVKDMKMVIDLKINEWGGSDLMSKYIRPSTLFGQKYDEYLNQAKTKE